MHLLIDNYGAKLEVEDEKFKISCEENVRYVSAMKLLSINILKPCVLTTPAIALAARNQVPLLVYNKVGKVEACIWSHSYGNIADIRARQAFYCQSDAAIAWIRQLLQLKQEGQLQNLTWLADRVRAAATTINSHIANIKDLKPMLKKADTKEGLRALEAQASKRYWEALCTALQNYVAIPGRIKKGASDPFNISINYLYGILYGHTEASLIRAGLDPYMGLLHINRHQRPVLAYDHIEPFRHWADRVAATLFMHGFHSPRNFGLGEKQTMELTGEGKRMLITSFFAFLEQRSYLNGRRIKNRDHIQYLSSSLVATLKKFPII